MAYLYLDDSKHHRAGFSLAAFVICETDPTGHIEAIIREFGLDPSDFEYKSSTKMANHSRLRDLRNALRQYIARRCRIAVFVVDGDKRIGPAALRLLCSTLSHPSLEGRDHKVFFDEGLFRSPKSAAGLASKDGRLARCQFHFEQDSSKNAGIQLADLVSHTCSTMLLDTLGHIAKTVVLSMPGDSAYDGLGSGPIDCGR